MQPADSTFVLFVSQWLPLGVRHGACFGRKVGSAGENCPAVAAGVTSLPRACVLAASVPGHSHGTAAGEDWPRLCPPPRVTGSGYPKPSGWKPQQLSLSHLWRPAVRNERVTGPLSLPGRSLPCCSQLLVFAGFLGIPWLVDTPLSLVSVFSCHPASQCVQLQVCASPFYKDATLMTAC